jgi:hypothetical protein
MILFQNQNRTHQTSILKNGLDARFIKWESEGE